MRCRGLFSRRRFAHDLYCRIRLACSYLRVPSLLEQNWGLTVRGGLESWGEKRVFSDESVFVRPTD
jgi:hypothetical protein